MSFEAKVARPAAVSFPSPRWTRSEARSRPSGRSLVQCRLGVVWPSRAAVEGRGLTSGTFYGPSAVSGEGRVAAAGTPRTASHRR